MKIQNRVIAALLAGVLLLNMTACAFPGDQQEVPEAEEPVEEAESKPSAPEKPKEQASLVDSDLMLGRLRKNLLSPLSARIRSREDSSVKIELSTELLEEIAGFLCQNYQVLRFDAEVDLRDSIYLQVIGENEIQDIYVTPWLTESGTEYTFVQVEEGNVMGQYVYDPTTYGALEELLAVWKYENTVSLDGNYQILTSQEYLEGLKSGQYRLDHLLQFEDRLLFVLDGGKKGESHFEVVDTVSGDTIQTITMDKPVMDVRTTDLDGYDFYVLTEDSVHYRSSSDTGLKLDFQIPQAVQEKLLQGLNYPMFDVDYINDELVYISSEGLVLSNQSGKRQDLLLRHDRLPELLSLSAEENPEWKAYYAAPQLMNGGRLIVCPILLQEEETYRWAGFSIFNLMNGTGQDYLNEFDSIDSFSYPDDQNLLVRSKSASAEMNVVSRQIVRREWAAASNETIFLHTPEQILIYRQGMNYESELLTASLDRQEEPVSLLRVEGDYFTVYGVTKDYALVGWSDSLGDFMAVVSCSQRM